MTSTPVFLPSKKRIRRKRQPAPVALTPDNSNGFVSVADGGTGDSYDLTFSDVLLDAGSFPATFSVIQGGSPLTIIGGNISSPTVVNLIIDGAIAPGDVVTVATPANLVFDNGLPLRPPLTRTL